MYAAKVAWGEGERESTNQLVVASKEEEPEAREVLWVLLYLDGLASPSLHGRRPRACLRSTPAQTQRRRQGCRSGVRPPIRPPPPPQPARATTLLRSPRPPFFLRLVVDFLQLSAKRPANCNCFAFWCDIDQSQARTIGLFVPFYNSTPGCWLFACLLPTPASYNYVVRVNVTTSPLSFDLYIYDDHRGCWCYCCPLVMLDLGPRTKDTASGRRYNMVSHPPRPLRTFANSPRKYLPLFLCGRAPFFP